MCIPPLGIHTNSHKPWCLMGTYFTIYIEKELKATCVYIINCCYLVAKSCPTLQPMDCSLPGSSVHGISQARILEWATIYSSRSSSQPRFWTPISCLAGAFFTAEPPMKLIVRGTGKWNLAVIACSIFFSLQKELVGVQQHRQNLTKTGIKWEWISL